MPGHATYAPRARRAVRLVTGHVAWDALRRLANLRDGVIDMVRREAQARLQPTPAYLAVAGAVIGRTNTHPADVLDLIRPSTDREGSSSAIGGTGHPPWPRWSIVSTSTKASRARPGRSSRSGAARWGPGGPRPGPGRWGRRLARSGHIRTRSAARLDVVQQSQQQAVTVAEPAKQRALTDPGDLCDLCIVTCSAPRSATSQAAASNKRVHATILDPHRLYRHGSSGLPVRRSKREPCSQHSTAHPSTSPSESEPHRRSGPRMVLGHRRRRAVHGPRFRLVQHHLLRITEQHERSLRAGPDAGASITNQRAVHGEQFAVDGTVALFPRGWDSNPHPTDYESVGPLSHSTPDVGHQHPPACIPHPPQHRSTCEDTTNRRARGALMTHTDIRPRARGPKWHDAPGARAGAHR